MEKIVIIINKESMNENYQSLMQSMDLLERAGQTDSDEYKLLIAAMKLLLDEDGKLKNEKN